MQDRGCWPDVREERRALSAGKVVAVDISQWACNALTQQATADLWSEEGRVIKMAFDRVCHVAGWPRWCFPDSLVRVCITS